MALDRRAHSAADHALGLRDGCGVAATTVGGMNARNGGVADAISNAAASVHGRSRARLDGLGMIHRGVAEAAQAGGGVRRDSLDDLALRIGRGALGQRLDGGGVIVVQDLAWRVGCGGARLARGVEVKPERLGLR